MAGINQADNVCADNFSSMTDFNNEITAILDDVITNKNNINIGPKFIGGHTFSPHPKNNKIWGNFPRGCFVLPECLATITDDGSWLTISKKIDFSDNHIEVAIKFKDMFKKYIKLFENTLPKIESHNLIDIVNSPTRKNYINSISSTIENIKANKMKKVVLSRLKKATIEREFCEISALQILRSTYPDCTNYFISFPNQGVFFGSTPERLLKKYNQTLITEALAGTIKRGSTRNEDNLYERILRDSNKNQNEHQFVIDEIINKLTPYTKSISISNNPDILKLENVQHLKSIIKTKLNKNISLLELIKILHPTPAVAGAPIKSALKYINENEKHDRGWYSGPIGWIDSNGNGDIFVALRSALYNNNFIHVFSGSGIVSQSSPESEWEETEMKSEPILNALCGEEIIYG